MKNKQIIALLVGGIIGGLVAVFAYSALFDNQPQTVITRVTEPVNRVNFVAAMDSSSDFTHAAESTINGVVHVKTSGTVSYRNPIYDFFYGERSPGMQRPVESFGSGVIITEDGYIVTNNHVIENSNTISVVLNDKREYTASIVGIDPTTDLALLKIDANDLNFIPFGNSDALRVGEWVLAVGNPFNITSSVTAGIVSAKSRSMEIIQDDYRIESFIQTDAAVNSGNSGGALVNLRGELIGINTAIATPTGGNVGISFAIPASIIEKVVTDIIEYGTVQRAIMGITIEEVTSRIAEENKLDNLEGVLVTGIVENGAAEEAGIRQGDVILLIDGVKVSSPSMIQERVGRYRPGDKITVTVKRNNKTQQFTVTLRNL